MTIEYITQHRALGTHQYAVIDRQLVPELPGSWPVIELILPMLAPQAHLYPWLVTLSEMPSPEWKTFMADLSAHAGPRSPEFCSLLLSSTLSPQQIQSALVNALYFKDAGHNGHILRFYDPRVLFHLHWMLSPWQLSNLLSARDIPCWTFWLEDGWHTLEFTDHAAVKPTDTAAISLHQIAHCGLINQALQQLPSYADMQQRQHISRRLESLMMQAAKCGLSTDEDRIAFALHGLIQPEGFWAARNMSVFLQQASQYPDLYRNETHSWDESRWQEVIGTRSNHAGSTF
jgi:hypothetical protein